MLLKSYIRIIIVTKPVVGFARKKERISNRGDSDTEMSNCKGNVNDLKNI